VAALEARIAELEVERDEQTALQAALDARGEEIDGLKGQLRRERITHALAAQASALGIHNVDHVRALVDVDAFEVAEDGTVTGVEEALTALAAENPYLVATAPPPNTNATDQNSPTGAMTVEERREFAAIYGLNPEYVR
jgi:hypothetical protein